MSTAAAHLHGDRRDTSRLPIVIVLIAGLVLSVFARTWSLGLRAKPAGESSVATGSSLSIGRFDSYTLALLLGGLRGPLVMVLWTTSEQQKSDRNLDDFDTKVEWIRLLQPEFDSVHIFQVWNKAYNISVQMASPSNKYATILDAIDYGEKVDEERPNDINILVSMAQVWFDKLGGSNEKAFYRAKVREQSLPHGTKSKLKRDDVGFRRTELDPVLDEAGNILPQYLVPTLKTPLAGPSVMLDSDVYDGSKLQFLKEWQPFPQGVSPLAFGYNLYKRAQVLQSNGKQRHLQLSDMVIDSRPALCLKTWSEEEWERARRFEITAFAIPSPQGDRLALEMPAANVPLDAPITDRKALEAAIYCYARTAALGEASLKEYERHLKTYTQSMLTYRSHQDTVKATTESSLADEAYLRAMLVPAGVERTKFIATAVQHYGIAREMYSLSVIRYYTEDQTLAAILPPGTTKYNLEFNPAKLGALAELVAAAMNYEEKNAVQSQNTEDRNEYLTYIARSSVRLEKLGVK